MYMYIYTSVCFFKHIIQLSQKSVHIIDNCHPMKRNWMKIISDS